MNKFGKNREVDSQYLNVPCKYLNYDGANCNSKPVYRYETYEEWKESMNDFIYDNPIFEYFKNKLSKKDYENWKKKGLYMKKILVKKGRDKSLCIIDFYGKNLALVGWRNNNTYKMGMTKMCKIVWRKNKGYIDYNGKLLPFTDKYGWVF